MLIEWLRRHDAQLDKEVRTYLFTEESIAAAEAAGKTDADGDPNTGSLGIGSLRNKRAS